MKYVFFITSDDARDKDYKTDGTAQQIVWAIGPLNTNDEAAKHYVGAGRISRKFQYLSILTFLYQLSLIPDNILQAAFI